MFRFPHLQLLILTTYMMGLCETTSTVYGTHWATMSISTELATVSTSVFSTIVVFLVVELVRVLRFHSRHGKSLWEPSPPVDSVLEMDDPILRLLARCKLIRPTARCRGEYVPPEAGVTEPFRTEYAKWRLNTLGGLLPFCGNQLPGLTAEQRIAVTLEDLTPWLEDGAGNSLRGVTFALVMTICNLLIITSVGMYRLLSETHSWAQVAALTSILTVQLFMVVWFHLGHCNDRLEAIVASLSVFLEAMATCLLLVAKSGGASVGDASANLLTASIGVLIFFGFYNSSVLPLLDALQKRRETGQPIGLALCGVLLQVALLPLIIFMTFFGFMSGAGDGGDVIMDAGADCADEISVVADPEEFAGPDLAANAEPQANPVDEAIGAPAAYIYNV